MFAIGTGGRTTPRKLEKKIPKEDGQPEGVAHYLIKAEPVGEILTVTICIRHRHMTDDWFLKSVTVSDTLKPDNAKEFPCQCAVQSKVTLRPGDGEYKFCHVQTKFNFCHT